MNELIRRIRKLGFEGPYPGTGHAYIVKEERSRKRLYGTNLILTMAAILAAALWLRYYGRPESVVKIGFSAKIY